MPVDTSRDLTTSARIRRRLEDAGQRYFANDNISGFLEEGDLEALQDEIESAVDRLLNCMVIDTSRDHNTRDTAQRVARMYLNEVFSGRYIDAPDATEFPNAASLNELMIVGPITVRSACSHHLCPIMGRIWIGILPNASSNLIGLSKYARLTNWIMCRPQIQEEAVVQLADKLETMITPDGIAIVMEADHFCMHWRGIKDENSQMISSIMRGQFLEDESLRREFLALIRLRQA